MSAISSNKPLARGTAVRCSPSPSAAAVLTRESEDRALKPRMSESAPVLKTRVECKSADYKVDGEPKRRSLHDSKTERKEEAAPQEHKERAETREKREKVDGHLRVKKTASREIHDDKDKKAAKEKKKKDETSHADLTASKQKSTPTTTTSKGSSPEPTLMKGFPSLSSSNSSQQKKRYPNELPQHQYHGSPPGPTESEEGIVESSRSFLTRLSLEDAVVALQRLQSLMMSHIAAVTGSAQPAVALPAESGSTREMHVDPFKLSTRPLESIAEDLCKQLRDIADAYEASSAAERSLMGCPSTAAILPAVAQTNAVDAFNSEATFGPMVDTRTNFGDTFGPMYQTTVASAPETYTDPLSTPASKRTSPQAPDRLPAVADDDSVFGELYSTQYTYPNGTVVSFPVSTFGEKVNTKSISSENYCPVAAFAGGRLDIGVQTDDPLADPWGTPSLDNTNGNNNSSSNNNSASTVSATAPPLDKDLLDRYLKALEKRLSDKERLDALREARRDQRRGGEATTSALSHLAFKQSLTEKK